jgi:hypothetical protein
MAPVGSIGVAELITILCVCCVPIIVVAGVVIGLLVWIGRRKPKRDIQEVPPRAPAPPSRAEPMSPENLEREAGAKAVTASDLATKSCPSCGGENPVDSSFCEYCGASFAEE